MLYKFFVKRFLDVLVSSFIVILLIPITILIFIFSCLIDKEFNIIFRQQRPGLNGRIFTIYKYKTMRDLELNNKLSDLQRVTIVGKFLRISSIDELPQFYNILKGEMSLIGPRPLLVNYLNKYTPYQFKRHNVRPGITGLAQISGRNNLTFEKRFILDVNYVENLSLLLDLKIFLKTFFYILKKQGVSVQDPNEFR